MTNKPSIGFIGLGLMGSAMVQRLIDCGYPVTVIANRSRANVDKAVARGATEVMSARAVAEASDIVMLCMDTSVNVEARMYGEDGVIAKIFEVIEPTSHYAIEFGAGDGLSGSNVRRLYEQKRHAETYAQMMRERRLSAARRPEEHRLAARLEPGGGQRLPALDLAQPFDDQLPGRARENWRGRVGGIEHPAEALEPRERRPTRSAHATPPAAAPEPETSNRRMCEMSNRPAFSRVWRCSCMTPAS